MKISVFITILWLGISFLPKPTLGEDSLLIATTTSTENSGLLHYLMPIIRSELGFEPRFIITGSGKALKLGRNKDVDLVWVHDEQGELDFIKSGYGLRREKVMYNRFVLIGPNHDPAQAATASNILEALHKIQNHQSLFISRGDDSGTHRKERSLWQKINPQHPILQQKPLEWYRELGSGMGATINTASVLKAYTLTDEATWHNHSAQKGMGIIFQNDALLRNNYGILMVSNSQTSRQKLDQANDFIDWLISDRGQKVIGDFRIQGKAGFFPKISII